MNINLTEQENKVVDFLITLKGGKAYWEELAQFAKDPQTVKIKTVKKTVSEIKRKYALIGEPLPFNVTFKELAHVETVVPVELSPEEILNTIPKPPTPQTLVQIKRTPGGNTVVVSPNTVKTEVVHPCHVDFVLNRNSRRVHTKEGAFNLNDNEWNVFAYLHEHVGKLVSLSELRDKVVYQHYGSKLPARWFARILSIIGNIRRQIPGIRQRLMTIPSPGQETKFLFQ